MNEKLLERANNLKEKIRRVENRINNLSNNDCFRISTVVMGRIEGLDDAVEEAMRKVGIKLYKEELKLLEKEFDEL